MTYLALLAARHGRRPGYAAVLGVAAGLAILGLLASVGLGALINAAPPVYWALRWGGVLYLLYLAWEAWTDDSMSRGDVADDGRYFRRGLITNLLNPKAAVFYVAVMPGFVPADHAGWGTVSAFAAVYVLIATGVHAGIVTLAATVRPMLSDRRVLAVSGKIFAVALVGVAIWVAYATRQPV
jgi:threonine/homoserine/homoserine lactone efflux protein